MHLIRSQVIAPEASNGEPYDHKADIYAFGIILWEIVTRIMPFSEYDFQSEIAERVCEGLRPSIPDFTPSRYRALIEQCWVCAVSYSHALFSCSFLASNTALSPSRGPISTGSGRCLATAV